MRESAGDAAVRHRLVRLAVLPAGLIAVAGAAVVAYVMRVRGGIDATGAPGAGAVGAPVWGVLAGSLLLVSAVIVTAAMLASSEARGTAERCAALRRSTALGQAELQAILRGLERGERPQPRSRAPESEPVGDALDLLTHECALAQRGAEVAVAEAAALVRSTYSGSEEKVEVFVNLARRLQSLVHREIELLDELENDVEDPDLLKGLFHVDHLATRIRRHAENLAVLGGAVSRRQWTRPVTMTEVLRSSIAEVEQYPRVKLVPPIEGTLRGHAVADVIHLLAELIENATVYSAPQTQVLLRAQHVTAGLAVEVEDRGLGMTAAEQNHMNAVLSEPEQIDVPELLRDGRIGLFVVSALARRHGVVVQLQNNIYGGIQAVLVLPRGLLGEDSETAHGAGSGTAPGAAPAGTAGWTAAGTAAGTAGVSAAEDAGRPAPPGVPAAAPQVRAEPAGPALPEETGAPGHAPASVPDPRPRSHARVRKMANGPTSAPHRPGTPPPFTSGPASVPQAPPPPVTTQPVAPQPASAQSVPSQPGPQQPGFPPESGAGQTVPQWGELPGEALHGEALHGEEPPEQGGNEAAASPADGDRPRLPKRRRQEHLVPELRDPPAFLDGGARAQAVAEEGHDPGLMAAFRRGTSLADEAGRTDLSDLTDLAEGQDPATGGEVPGGPSPAPDGDTSRPAR
ncbi:ATP-binding protein [Streptomyces iconiensis]|uniref:histidine kinase n=1 Tax=Streptomyces iconiensis TaxID=1384038 RepID=A0ABT6ZPX2_9ACTN|nr:ATP-binding protein [Streptomyces iconiensis]MDJ1131107.1 ATP-binding protein [Streptomyces iconiensis]